MRPFDVGNHCCLSGRRLQVTLTVRKIACKVKWKFKIASVCARGGGGEKSEQPMCDFD